MSCATALYSMNGAPDCPVAVEDHPDHPQHTLVYFSNVPDKFFGVFWCDVRYLPCNGFAYSCVQCQYHIDVNCAFIPKEITHNAHPNHLFSIADKHEHFNTCRMCSSMIFGRFSLRCQTCDIHIHPKCALLLNQTITHKCDTHPMKLSYYPAENHKGEYFCEICEEELNPEMPFYHCHECHQSIHPPCAPSIRQSETHYYLPFAYNWTFVFEYLNIKFGGIYKTQNHPHPLSFAQGIATDGTCANCRKRLQYEMIFKCQQCDQLAIHYDCHKTLPDW
uniref:uncharacterized protein LOC122606477 n=1 Tax=Erigeron canadensis TaxID=72917 RepID=UPI001CB90C57|nr:uncharacterized protein LOC122606477 [Erigeron canadensis]